MRVPYEYAVIQAVPRIERGELINVGVILYCQRLDFLEARTELNEERLLMIDPGADVEAIRAALMSWGATCGGAGAAGDISLGERFRWLVAPRSTVLRAGPVHMGLAADPGAELGRLVTLLVRPPEARTPRAPQPR
ncbi:DUF3037 domain-containing protein [Actinoplanes solisilvae]|uniref:DUF3037 domain-containing protein n=1 Tax=Actinoplanes solisilvae TaxID=2486853 RepID=UPI000FD6FD98|nr:DUF3037 domain-containing protein [Actinoplanes solisilvae]